MEWKACNAISDCGPRKKSQCLNKLLSMLSQKKKNACIYTFVVVIAAPATNLEI